MKKRTAKILTTVGVVIVMLGVTYAIAVAVSAAQLRRAYAEIEKAGRPMRAAEVIPPTVPDAENGALLYQSAALLLRAQPAPFKEPDQRHKDLLGYINALCSRPAKAPLDPNESAELQELLAQDVVTRALDLVHEGTLRPAYRFEHDYTNGLQLNPFLSDLQGLARVLGARARLESDSGRVAPAWELAQSQLKFSDALRQEPVFVSQLLRLATIRLSCETIQELCRCAPPDRQQSRALAGLLQAMDDNRPLVLAADGERLLIGEWLYNMPKRQLHEALRKEGLREGSLPGLLDWPMFHRVTFRPNFLADHAAYLKHTYESVRIFQSPYSHEDRKEPETGRCRLSSILMFAVWRIKAIHLETAARMRITRSGLALLEHKQMHGTFPPSLEALGLEGLADPFIDQPLRYRADGDGFVVYSVGQDLKDDGGNARQPKQKTDFDIVWQFRGGPQS
jgi:hypothetical protein